MYLKAIELTAAKTATNGNEYKVVTFQELSEFALLPGGGQTEIKTNARPQKRTLWSNQDGLFSNLDVNDVTFGTIKRFEVDEYEIAQADGTIRKATSFSGVQFRGESDDATCARYGKKLRKNSPMITAESQVNAVVANEPVVSVGQPIQS